ncbi:hypothetical protein HanIR_Chr06g0277361 [Helianthus annuus]|nr:hypothetical protein HanIR_Chr06g0277311 [Helianthus annuus]KAJ0566774.1 hypothetical protein HanIR_Chr06g0277361 [Helianthus annuus]
MGAQLTLIEKIQILNPFSFLKHATVTDGPDNQTPTENSRVKLKLEDINWDHSFVRELPGDPLTDITSREFQKEIEQI